MIDERTIRRSWEAFNSGKVPCTAIRSVVLASWHRSRQHGIAIDCQRAPLLSEGELFRRQTASASLLAAARPALLKARTFLEGADSMIILVEPSGLILDVGGDRRTLDRGCGIHLERGGRWSEADIGTNAIGTVLAVGAPVQIHGPEHFCADVQRWTCAAAPIHHPLDKTLIGILDISGDAVQFQPQSLAYAVLASQQIEGMIEHAIRAEHEQLLLHVVAKRSLWLSEEMLALDAGGRIIYTTDHIQHAIEAQHPGLIQNHRVPFLAEIPADRWPARLQELLPTANIELIRQGDQALGAMILLHKRARSPATPDPKARPALKEERIVTFDQILGRSRALREVIDRARHFAQADTPVLIEGETGVGKELFARAICQDGSSNGHFVPVNCGGLPHELIASELFGYAAGAFTGARAKGQPGKLAVADGGLLCLDEIGEMPIDLQTYLLRVLDDGVVYPIGSNQGQRVQVRFVAMTNRDLAAEVAAGRFRHDLYHRLSVLRLTIPPLRARGDDVVLLAAHFCRLSAARLGRAAPALSAELLAALAAYTWPGNVRQLRNVIEAMVVGGHPAQLGLADLPSELLLAPRVLAPQALPASAPADPVTNLKLSERATIEAAVAACRGNLTRAAQRLGIARSTLYRRLVEHGLTALMVRLP
ncbi:MAG: sigma-54-dependent Fis family transcriptional regulator [Acidiphilium sp.]|nr:sigma-54-dependent Fis family transcriptional regulator [Acidiphilium sp.]MDD4936082.1 sigma-54-dependent Fis family transcriptional regulator [Acidiphilium sp.]